MDELAGNAKITLNDLETHKLDGIVLIHQKVMKSLKVIDENKYHLRRMDKQKLRKVVKNLFQLNVMEFYEMQISILIFNVPIG